MNTPNIDDIYFPVKNGKIHYAGQFADIKHHRFHNQPTFLQGFISQDTINKVKQYLTVSDFPSWLQTDVIASQQNRYLYELIPTDFPVYPYFDIEFDAEQLDEKTVLDVLSDVFSECFTQIGVDSIDNVSLFCASGEVGTDKIASGWKASFHIILNTTQVFRNTSQHKAFIKNIVMPFIYYIIIFLYIFS